MIVVDTNIIAYQYLSADHAERLANLLRYDRAWIAPRLWRSELRNTLATYVRQNMLRLQEALLIMEDAEALVGGKDYEPASSTVLSLAHTSGCSAYDCEFVALAQDLGVPLITYDRTLWSRFPTIAITPEQYLGGIAFG